MIKIIQIALGFILLSFSFVTLAFPSRPICNNVNNNDSRTIKADYEYCLFSGSSLTRFVNLTSGNIEIGLESGDVKLLYPKEFIYVSRKFSLVSPFNTVITRYKNIFFAKQPSAKNSKIAPAIVIVPAVTGAVAGVIAVVQGSVTSNTPITTQNVVIGAVAGAVGGGLVPILSSPGIIGGIAGGVAGAGVGASVAGGCTSCHMKP